MGEMKIKLFKKSYHVHHSGCPYLEIIIIPRILWIRYYYATTKNLVFYFMVNLKKTRKHWLIL